MAFTEYVAGFLLCDRSRNAVLIVRKNRPEWQKGKLNGIGGHIEDGETPIMAMNREFLEETGVEGLSWSQFCTLEFPEARVHFFRAFGVIRSCPESPTDEEIVNVQLGDLWLHETIPNIKWLIPMALSMDADRADSFTITEHMDPSINKRF